MNIYLDIETVPSQDPDVKADLWASITPPGNYSKPESIAKWEAECKPPLVEEAWLKTAMDGALGQIVCASVAFDDNPTRIFYAENWMDVEGMILGQMFDAISSGYDPSRHRRPTFIGHNLIGFDLRFIYQRAVVHGIRPPLIIPFDAKPWDEKVFDTMIKWSGVGKSVSLDKLCRTFNLPKKGTEIGQDIDGSKVWEFVKAGKISDVAHYCAADVERVRKLHKRMTFSEAA